MVEINDTNFQNEIVDAGTPAIVDFWAEWGMPCKKIAPALEEAAGELLGKVKVGKLNVDNSNGVPTQLGVMNIPTLVFFKDGKEVLRSVGIVSKGDILRKAEEAFGKL